VLTVEGLALLLNMPASWVYERTRREEIPGFKVGKYGRFREDEVLAWFEHFRRGPTARKSQGCATEG
jgi:excisionase family DNA binding protein